MEEKSLTMSTIDAFYPPTMDNNLEGLCQSTGNPKFRTQKHVDVQNAMRFDIRGGLVVILS